MNIASFCIKHKVTTIMAFIVMSIFGFTTYSDLKLTLIPEISYPGAYVTCNYIGAAPEDVEELVTRPLEASIATVPGVKNINSTSSENVSTIMIEYNEGTDVDMASMKLREKLDLLTLPEGCKKPMVQNMNMNDMIPVMALAVMGNNLSEVQRMVDSEIKPALERIEGVAAVTVYGGIEEQVTIAVDSARLSGYNLSISSISQFLATSNLLQPGGEIKSGTQSLTVSTDGTFQSVSDIAELMIPLPSGGSVRLSELADVYLDQKEQDTIAKSNGEPALALNIMKQSDSNEVETARAIHKVLNQLKEKNPDFNYLIAHDSSEYIESSASSAMSNIIMGIILSAVVVFVFLRRLGSTLAIAISMPFCIISIFVVMKLFDITLNMISLGGIALGVGMIVDNSIVVLENIYRYAADGHSRYDACVKGTQEVALPVMASTLTTIAVFLPIGLAGGIAGMMFKDFCLTITFLLTSSLLIAMTLVPLLCYFLLDETKVRQSRLSHDEKAPPFANIISGMRSKYLTILRFFIRKRYVAVLISIGLVAIFLVSCISTKSVLLPDVDQGDISLSVSFPVGTELENCTAIFDKVSSLVEQNTSELKYMYYYTQGTGGQLTLKLVDKSERDRSSKEVAAALRDATKDVAGCEISISTSSMTGMASNGGSDISVPITGDNYEVLAQLTNELKAKIAALPGAVNVKSSLEDASPAVKINLKRDNAASYGLTAATIGAAVRAELNGATATTITLDGDDVEVVLKGNAAVSASLDALRSMPISTPTGGQIPLSSVATVDIELSPQTITRTDQSRQVSITGDIDSNTDLATVNQQITELLASYQMPQGYTADTGGNYEEMNKSFGQLILALTVALGLVYFVLASQFESFIMPIIVMMILPIALAGALFGLPLTGSDLSMVAIVGLIMLSGVVVNASIILVDYIKVRRLMGHSKEDAILEACPLRIRPILMTTLTTVLGMLPMSLGIGDGAELMQPMSIVMISGMVIATIVTLFFTPVYYSLLDSLNDRLARFFFRKKYKAMKESAEQPPVP